MSITTKRPLRTMFLLTSMPVGGAETLLVNLVRRLDRQRVVPLIGCLKQRDVLGAEIAAEVPVFEHLIHHKYDLAVLPRLKKLFRQQQIDALITVGAGDKMFWGRLAAWSAGVPVILSALHSTGWPDGVGKLNRLLTGITDGFIAVARQHAEFQIEHERFPKQKVFLIPNGIDTDRFQRDLAKRTQWRKQLGIAADAPVVGIVAALRPEKNHALFLQAAKIVSLKNPQAHFVIAGDGPERSHLESLTAELQLSSQVHFLGSTSDVVGVLSMLDLFALTSDNEASPVSIMEALSCTVPVVSSDVGSINETVIPGRTGYLVPAGNAEQAAAKWLDVIANPGVAHSLGRTGRQHVIDRSSLDRMTDGYVELIEKCYAAKTLGRTTRSTLNQRREIAIES